jgi:hypothetical protein
MVAAPGKEPCLHVFVFDVVPGLDLSRRLARFRQQSFLIGNVRFDGVGDEKIGASTGGLCQLRKALFCFRFKAHAEGGASCVRHEHILTHREWGRKSGRDSSLRDPAH